ncbi:flagellar hook-associated protein FlgK [Methylocystis parvus]|uniref:Flagellar hook-associated protein 1 n=1 Tax=Methylocystis parvus TaxID=134 RepID=A0A6B8LZW7_9HYPH|nr:flagellar hook-associated protein FlgK [Methylocystis parvus]QGM98007.1 flagellar hook-associated protein FlgK [Methylocystis parvus]WBK01677.1 flagellar hook-associated protein FlgK [Methylocystis parvus OBBP]
MSLTSAGAVAAKSLGVISNEISVASRNISAAGIAGVSAKRAKIAAGDEGVAFLGVGRAADAALFRSLVSASASQAGETAIADSLARLDQSMNLQDSANSRSPAALIGKLSSALQAYSASPANETAAQLTLDAAQDVVASLRDAATAAQTERRQADIGIASAVNDVNSLLARFGALNSEIVSGSVSGADVTDALDQRDDVLLELSKIVGVTTVMRSNNDMVLYTDSGVTLFETTPRHMTFSETTNLSPGVSGAAIFIDGVQITGAGAPLALNSGTIQALAKIRDELAPRFQTQLDEIARGLVAAFAEKDQSGAGGKPLPGLFTYPGASEAPGASLMAGLAGAIEVNANVDPARGGLITRLRDGGVSNDPAYIYNSSGATGYSTRLIELAGADAAPQSFDPAAGLSGSGSLKDFASAAIGWLAAQRKQSDGATSYFDALVSQTTQALSNATGVNLDDQMTQMLALENSYQASAKLLEAVNSLFDSLLSAIRA